MPPKQEIIVNVRDPDSVSIYKCSIRDLSICDVVFKDFFSKQSVGSLGALYKGAHAN